MAWGVRFVGMLLILGWMQPARAETLRAIVQQSACDSALSGLVYRLSIHEININGDGEWRDEYGVDRGEVVDGMGEAVNPKEIPEIEIPREELQLEIVTETPVREERMPPPGILPHIPVDIPAPKKDPKLPN